MMLRKYKKAEAKEALIFEKASYEIFELCNAQLVIRKGEDPFQALERFVAIRLAHDELQSTLAEKPEATKQEQKKGLKL